MDLRQLQYFEAVARHQHVSRAADELKIAQPALSRQIHALERELGGVPLFERRGRNIRLTDAGARLQAHAQEIIARIHTAETEIRELAGLKRGTVTIGAPPTVGARLLPDALAAFHQQYPQLELHIREGSTTGQLGLLLAGEIDLAIVTLPIARRGLWVTPLFTEALVAVVGHGHRLANRRIIAMAELEHEPFMLYPQGYEMREVTLAACKRAGFVPNVALDGGTMEMLLRLAEAGLGVALMPQLAVRGAPLVQLQIRDQSLQRSMVMVSRPENTLTRTTCALRSFLVERLDSARAD